MGRGGGQELILFWGELSDMERDWEISATGFIREGGKSGYPFTVLLFSDQVAFWVHGFSDGTDFLS
jgi:hypothetical protein